MTRIIYMTYVSLLTRGLCKNVDHLDAIKINHNTTAKSKTNCSKDLNNILFLLHLHQQILLSNTAIQKRLPLNVRVLIVFHHLKLNASAGNATAVTHVVFAGNVDRVNFDALLPILIKNQVHIYTCY